MKICSKTRMWQCFRDVADEICGNRYRWIKKKNLGLTRSQRECLLLFRGFPNKYYGFYPCAVLS